MRKGDGGPGFGQEVISGQAYLLGCHGFDGLPFILQCNRVQAAGGLLANGICLVTDIVPVE
ncbi:hypothetical protein D3C81_1217750 [compost metagenome]